MATAKKADETKKVTKATPAAALAKVEAVKKEEAAKKTAATETKACLFHDFFCDAKFKKNRSVIICCLCHCNHLF